MKLLCPDGLHRDLDEGSLCPNAFRRDGAEPCLGHLELVALEGSYGCTCGTSARQPCWTCENITLGCPDCRWRPQPEDRKA